MNVLNHQIDLAPESGALHGFVPIVVALLLRAGLMALSIPGWDAAMSISSNDPVPSAVPAIGVAASGPGVPDAATVFCGAVAVPEEAPPTF